MVNLQTKILLKYNYRNNKIATIKNFKLLRI